MSLASLVNSVPVAAAVAGVAGLVAGLVIGRLSAGSGTREPRARASRARGGDADVDDGFTGEGIELYVGNLSYDMTEPELKKTFGSYGDVLSVRIIKNKFNDRSKGYGFVEMAAQAGADKAVKAMHGKDVMGRKMVVNEARSRSRE